MKNLTLTILAAAALFGPPAASGQESPFARLPPDVLDVVPPSEWVRGTPGRLSIHVRECRSVPAEHLRRRIVDVAVQEWAFFGFPVLDRMNGARLLPPGTSPGPDRPTFEASTRRAPALGAAEAARVAASIAGYWAVTPEGGGIVETQNRAWNGRGVAARWNAPWSAAFISWVMCEAGLDSTDRFRRAIAHRTYIDQAIRARDGQAAEAAFVAYDIGERAVEPGDMLCAARRPRYRNLAERRRQLGTGASSHCDVIVQVDVQGERILAIGGNVLRSVSLKVFPGERSPTGELLPVTTPNAPLFAHLKLRAPPIDPDALLRSPTVVALTCTANGPPPPRSTLVLSRLGAIGEFRDRC